MAIISDILFIQPDLAALGVHILAAWSLYNPVSEILGDKKFVPYNIISGTSMSCPHATAIAAYIKSFHLSWSPAAIRSALMTTGNVHYPVERIRFSYGQIDKFEVEQRKMC